MKKVLAVIVMLFIVPLNGFALEKLTGATCPFEPYYGPDMKELGPFIKLTKMAFKEAGYDLTVEIKPWARCVKEAKEGKFDILVGVWYNEERSKWMAFSNPMLDNEVGFYKRKGSDLTFSGYPDLKAKNVKIGTVRNYVNPKGFDDAKLFIEPANDDITNMRKLLKGRIDLVLVDRLIAKHLVQKEMKDRVDELVWIATLQKNPLMNGILKTTKRDWKTIHMKFNEGVDSLKSKGLVSEVLNEYGL